MRPGIISGSTKIQSKEHIISVPKLGGSLLELGDPPRWQHPKPHGQDGLGQGGDQAMATRSPCCFTAPPVTVPTGQMWGGALLRPLRCQKVGDRQVFFCGYGGLSA